MTSRRKLSAISASVPLALLFIVTTASAASIGSVTDLDGTLLVARANGSVRVLGMGSAVEEGDILASSKQTYATLTLADSSAVTLGPDTALKVERYVFDRHTPDNDGALFALAKGSVRIDAGLLGTRSGDAFTLATPTATIDMRGASVIAEYVAPVPAELARRDPAPGDFRLTNMVAVSHTPAASPGFIRTASYSNTLRLAQAPMLPAPIGAGLRPGLHVHVLDGVIRLSNSSGSLNFAAGQFGYTSTLQHPPMIVPSNPALRFTPPPAFSSLAGRPQGTPSATNPGAVDCQVR